MTCGAGQVCSGSACVFSCPAGQVACGGTCVVGTSLNCTTRIDLGIVGVGSVVTTPPRSLPAAAQEDWYVVQFPERNDIRRHGTGTPSISFAQNDGGVFRFTTSATCGGAASCAPGSAYGFVDSCATPGTGCPTRNVAWPAQLFIRVTRATGGPDCGP